MRTVHTLIMQIQIFLFVVFAWKPPDRQDVPIGELVPVMIRKSQYGFCSFDRYRVVEWDDFDYIAQIGAQNI